MGRALALEHGKQGSHGRERTARSSGVRCRITGGAAPSGSVGAGVKRIVYWPGRHKGKSMGGPFGKTAYVPVSVSSCNARIMYVNHDKVARWKRILAGSTTAEPRPVFFSLLHTHLPAPAPEPSCNACNLQPPGIFENKIPSQ